MATTKTTQQPNTKQSERRKKPAIVKGRPAEQLDIAAYSELDAQAKTAFVTKLNSEITAKESMMSTASREIAILYYRLGIILTDEKKQAGHGNWLDQLDDRGVDERRAQRAMQISNFFKDETSVSGLSLTDALAQSAPKKKPEPVSKRKQIIKGLESMQDKLHKFSAELSELEVAREPILEYVDKVETELKVLREKCAAEPVAQ